MTDDFKTYGVFVPEAIVETISNHLADEAGVINYADYFDSNTTTIPRGDPAAEITNVFLKDVASDFAMLYDTANFDDAQQVEPEDFELLTVAATPEVVVTLKELFRAAARIQNCDTRTVHTAIFRAALTKFTLPEIPENTVTFES